MNRTRPPSAPNAKIGTTLRTTLARPRYEVIPTGGANEWMDDLPREAKVTVTCSPARGIYAKDQRTRQEAMSLTTGHR